jgi:hypothetical protein
MTKVNYRISQHDVTTIEYALINHGANDGICRDDMLVLEGSERLVDVSGLAGHKVSQLCIVTAQALITTHKGEAIAIPSDGIILRGKAIAFFHVSSWKHSVQISMIVHICYQGGNNASW